MTFIHRAPITGLMTGYDNDQRAWIQAVLDRMGITATEFARRAGLDPSTLTRFMGGERDGHMLSARTMRKLEAVAARHEPRRAELREDAVPFTAEDMKGSLQGNPLAAAVAAMRHGRNGLDPWVVSSNQLEALRLYEGDVLLVDLNAEPRAGDIVCAQLYDWTRRSTRTVFRLYEPPFLLSGGISGRDRGPVAVDGQNVAIKGVVVARLSPREMLHLAS